MEYNVLWEIELDADSPRDAAEQALKIQRRVNSMAVVFDVIDSNGKTERVDLLEEEDEETIPCAKCGLHVPESDGIEDEGEAEEKGKVFFYCSEKCRVKH